MFRRAALLRSGGIVVGVIAVGLTAFEVTLHVTAIDAGRLKAIPLPATTAALATPSPLADVGRVALSRVVTVEADRLGRCSRDPLRPPCITTCSR